VYKLIKAAVPLHPTERADLIYNSEALESAHNAAAQRGDTAPPSAGHRVPYHFIAFVKTEDNRLWELEGGWNGPIDRGTLLPHEDALSQKALDFGVRKFMEKAGGELQFSLVAVCHKDGEVSQ